jgi:hypothetical protein
VVPGDDVSGEEHMDDYFNFRFLVTPRFISGGYAAGALLVSVAAAVGGYLVARQADNAVLGLVGGTLAFVVFNLIWRLVCELWIIFFAIHDRLVELARIQLPQGVPGGPQGAAVAPGQLAVGGAMPGPEAVNPQRRFMGLLIGVLAAIFVALALVGLLAAGLR